MATLRFICFALIATSLVASAAFAQNDSKPLNLTVPPSIGFPQASAASAAPTSTTSATTAAASTQSDSTTPASTSTAPGAYDGDIGGAKLGGVAAANPDDATDTCDNKAQVHGDVETGVVAGNHISGNYQAGTVNITKPLGDCTHPSGGLSITVSASKSRFGYSRGNH
ncbi:MAG TPA: hypothetical protein VK660_10875 [Xanthomonadaceae bacterium]|jgi:hypothetical protein|nr:hypothetical protein [Xanthomonadaceae bacterium]